MVQAVQVRRHLVGDAPRHARPGRPGRSTARPRRTRGATSTSPRRTAFAACWSKAGTSAGTATGSRTARLSASREPYPDFDLEAARRVREAQGRAPDRPPRDRPATSRTTSRSSRPALDLYQRLGIDSVKTGYVADAGGIKALGEDGKIHFEWHDGQVMSRHHLKVVTEAAKRHIAVNRARADQGHRPAPHLSELGRARRRARHGVQRLGQPAESARARGEPGVHAHARRPDGLHARRAEPEGQAAASRSSRRSPSSSRSTSCSTARSRWRPTCRRTTQAIPAPFQFIKDVPTDWADTRVLNGEVGDYVTIVRKDRNSDDWYLGSVTDENARTLRVQLDFLDRGSHAIARRSIATATTRTGARIRRRSRSSAAKSVAATRCS